MPSPLLPTRDADDERASYRRRLRRVRMLDLLRHVPTFAVRCLRLLAFVVLLLPAFFIFLRHYLTCDRVVAHYGRDRGRGRSCRRYLDIYGSRSPPAHPSSSSSSHGGGGGGEGGKKPVVIFLTGGAWIIGYRMWGTLLGRALAPLGVLVIVPDYRNYPTTDVGGMVEDADASLQWTFDHAAEYGGDADGIVLVGQSAGAHIGGVLVASKVLDWIRGGERGGASSADDGEERRGRTNGGGAAARGGVESASLRLLESAYSPRQLRGFVSTSCPHNLVSMRRVLHRNGLSEDVQRGIFGGRLDDDERRYVDGDGDGDAEEDAFERWSPYHLVMKCHAEYDRLSRTAGGDEGRPAERPALRDVFPKLCVVHGTSDETVPVSEAIEFISLLERLNIPTETRIYHGLSHTDPILEAPMRGDHSYHRDIYQLVRLWTADSSPSDLKEGRGGGSRRTTPNMPPFDERHPMLRPICPSMLVGAARFCNPF